MDWFFRLLPPESVGLTVLILSVVAALGLGLGSLKLRGLSLGIGGVLFAGLFAGWAMHKAHPDGVVNAHVIEFGRDFGLILFVYTIGVQIGPGFLASLRKQGLPLNIMAASIVALGVLITILISVFAKVPMHEAVGLFAGATTNTPSLAAGQEALRATHGGASTSSTVAAYAIAYPFGIIGIILAMVLIRAMFGISIQAEADALVHQHPASALSTLNLEVCNPNLDGLAIRKIPGVDDDVVISRILHKGVMSVAAPEDTLALGDILLAVGPKDRLDELRVVVGKPAKVDLKAMPSHISTRRILVTKREALGRTVDELNLVERFDVTVTRVARGEVELPPSDNLTLQFGDAVLAVGEEAAIKRVAAELGDSLKRLNHPQVIPIFVGIALGVILGSLKLIQFEGMPAPVKLGLAGGPLVAAIVLSRLGHFGPLVWYMPQSANFMVRELGIVLFLACVGFKSGDQFFEKLIHGPGVWWLMYGAMITFIPLVTVGFIARKLMKLNFMSLCGLLSGSMTDPPALAFAGSVTGSDAPSIAYATVYPLVMLLRVIAAQVLVLIFV